MNTINQEFDIETYVLVEKAAQQAGITVEEWLNLILVEGVGHTSFYNQR